MQNVSAEHRAIWLKVGRQYFKRRLEMADLGFAQLYYAAMCLYLYASLSVKLSILVFLRRIFYVTCKGILPHCAHCVCPTTDAT